ncbi:MAG: magnesium chelatase, partial [Gemmatimonadales bacterium]
MSKPATLRDLAGSEWGAPERRTRTVKDEIRRNLICLLESDAQIFPGIVGYDDSVIPQLVNA